jgi:hypothetical protein
VKSHNEHAQRLKPGEHQREYRMDRPKPKFLTGTPTWLDNKWGRRILAVWAVGIVVSWVVRKLL